MFDFPNNPVVNQTVTAPNGGYFIWDGTKWTNGASPTPTSYLPISGGTMTGPITLSGNATLPLHAVPLQQINTAAAGGPFLTLSGGTLTGPLVLPGNATLPLHAVPLQQLPVVPAASSTPPLTDNVAAVGTSATYARADHVHRAIPDVGRNLLHNGLFNISQRGAVTATGNGQYPADRWVVGNSGNFDTISFTRVALTDADRTAIGDEAATTCLQNVFTTSNNASSSNNIFQSIEGLRRLAGKTVTMSFWAKANAALNVGVNYVVGPGSGGSPTGPAWAGSGIPVPLTTTWARKSVTFTMFTSTGYTLGTNGDDYVGFAIWYSHGAGPAGIGGIGLQSGTIQIWGVQIEVGSVVTPLEKPDPRYDLDNCCRFFQTRTVHGLISATAANQFVAGNPQFAPTMRAIPTVVVGALVVGAGDANIGAINVDGITTSGCRVWGSSLGAGQANLGHVIQCSADL